MMDNKETFLGEVPSLLGLIEIGKRSKFLSNVVGKEWNDFEKKPKI